MPPPDQPEKPKPKPTAAALEAMAYREAQAKAKAASFDNKPAPSKAINLTEALVEIEKPPAMPVGLAGFAVWLVAALSALALLPVYTVREPFASLLLPRRILAGTLAAILLLAIWFTQAIEQSKTMVKVVYAIAAVTILVSLGFFAIKLMG